MGLKPGDRSKGRNSPDAFEDPGAEKTPTFPSACAGGAPQKERGNGTSLSKAEGVPRRGEPAVHQPSPSASERESDATGVPSKQFHFFAASSRLIQASRGGLRGTFHSCTNHIKGQIFMCHHYNRSLW